MWHARYSCVWSGEVIWILGESIMWSLSLVPMLPILSSPKGNYYKTQSATEVSTRSSTLSTSSKTQNRDGSVSLLHFMSDSVQSYWNSQFLREEGVDVVSFTSFVNVKKPSHVFFNNENLDQVQYMVQKCIPIKQFNRILAFPLAPVPLPYVSNNSKFIPPTHTKMESLNKCDILLQKFSFSNQQN